MKTPPLIIAIAILATALVASLLTRSSASAPHPEAAPQAAASTQKAPAAQAPAESSARPARRLGTLPDAMREAVRAGVLDANITGPTAVKAFDAFQKASPEIKADRAARSKLAAAIEKAASHFADAKLEPACFAGTIDPAARDACGKRGKLWGIAENGEVEAQ